MSDLQKDKVNHLLHALLSEHHEREKLDFLQDTMA